MIGEINTKPQAGGIDIQGIINQYEVQSGGNISAGDFVEFINDWSNVSVGTETTMSPYVSAGDTKTVKAIKLDDDRVFIAYQYGSNKYLYGIVCNISGDSITYGSATQINTINRSGSVFDCTLLEDDKIFIAHTYGASSYYIYATLITINNTTITVNTSKQIHYANYSWGASTIIVIKSIMLSSNKVCVVFTYNQYNMASKICDINNNTITTGSTVTSANEFNLFDAIKISDTKIFIAHSLDVVVGATRNPNRLYAFLLNISGNTITQTTDKALSSNNYYCTYIPSLAKISNNKICVLHTINTTSASKGYIGGTICTISGNTITNTTPVQLENTSDTSGYNGMLALDLSNNKIGVLYCISSNRILMVCDVSNSISVLQNTTVLNHSIPQMPISSSFIKLSDDRIIINYNNSNYIKGTIITANDKYINSITTSSQKISGVAQEDGSGGDTIDVIEPYTS